VEVAAYLNYARLSPQKCRLVVNQIRGMSVANALNLLEVSIKKAAKIIKKVLKSAIANAEQNNGLDVDELYVSTIYVNQGSTYKRMSPRAKGRGNRILKPTCHIAVKVSSERVKADKS